MNFIRLTKNVGVIERQTINLGLLLNEGKCIVIDTGLDKTSGNKIHNFIKENNWDLEAIISTHSHADHIGGNRKLVELNKVPVYTSPWELKFLENPFLEPFSIFNGVKPPKILQNKFFMAPACPGENIYQKKDLLQKWEIEIIDLPGHTLGMIGVKKDGILFLGDAYYSEDVINKHPVPFLNDYDAFLETLNRLKNIPSIKYHVISHKGIYEVGKETNSLIEKNIDRLQEIYELIKNSIKKEPKTTEGLIKIIFEKYSIDCSTFLVYQLVLLSLNAYLSSLLDKKIIEPRINHNTLYWTLIS